MPQSANERPFTEIHHNNKSLILYFLDDDQKAKECWQCQIEFPRRQKIILYDVGLPHEEKWAYPDPKQPGHKLPSTQSTTASRSRPDTHVMTSRCYIYLLTQTLVFKGLTLTFLARNWTLKRNTGLVGVASPVARKRCPCLCLQPSTLPHQREYDFLVLSPSQLRLKVDRFLGAIYTDKTWVTNICCQQMTCFVL